MVELTVHEVELHCFLHLGIRLRCDLPKLSAVSPALTRQDFIEVTLKLYESPKANREQDCLEGSAHVRNIYLAYLPCLQSMGIRYRRAVDRAGPPPGSTLAAERALPVK